MARNSRSLTFTTRSRLARVPDSLYEPFVDKYGEDMFSRWVRTKMAEDLGLEPPDGPMPTEKVERQGGRRGRGVTPKELDEMEAGDG